MTTMCPTPLRLALTAAALAAAVLAPLAARAADPAPAPAVIDPKVERRDVKLPRLPSKDIEVGAFAGVYSTQNFGSAGVVGLRLGYHVTEDYFVEGSFGSSHASDESYRRILPAGIFSQQKAKLSYYNLSLGINVLPGEVFIGSRQARASALYLSGGPGSTSLDGQRHQTFNLGLGTRVFFGERFAARVDLRDHIFKLDLLGKQERTNNLELTAGLAFFF